MLISVSSKNVSRRSIMALFALIGLQRSLLRRLAYLLKSMVLQTNDVVLKKMVGFYTYFGLITILEPKF